MIIRLEKSVFNFNEIEKIENEELFLFGHYRKSVWYNITSQMIVVKVQNKENLTRKFSIDNKQKAEEYYNSINFIKKEDIIDFVKSDKFEVGEHYDCNLNNYRSFEIFKSDNNEGFIWYIADKRNLFNRFETLRDTITFKVYETEEKCKNRLIKEIQSIFKSERS